MIYITVTFVVDGFVKKYLDKYRDCKSPKMNVSYVAGDRGRKLLRDGLTNVLHDALKISKRHQNGTAKIWGGGVMNLSQLLVESKRGEPLNDYQPTENGRCLLLLHCNLLTSNFKGAT